jgi:hypothetical protein
MRRYTHSGTHTPPGVIPVLLQGIAGNKEGEFKVEALFLSKLHTNNAYFFFLNYY